MKKPQAACIYCRLSYAPDGSLEKVERQEGDCRDLGDRLDWGICCVYSDNNKSAWQRNRKRKDWDAMLASLEPGAICPRGNHHDGVLTYHGDRLNRQPWDLELLLKKADDRHIPLASPSGTRDLNNEDDRFILRIEVAQACKASADTSRRVKRGAKARAEKGVPGGAGKRPFGYGVPTGDIRDNGRPIYDLTKQVPEEAALIQEAANRLLAGESQYGVVRWLNTQSTTSQGNPWKWLTLKLLLRAPRTAGLIEHDGRLYDGTWDGILERDQWEDLKTLFERRRQENPSQGRERKYLLSGTAECVNCDQPMRTKPSGGMNRKTARLYHCWNPDCERTLSRNVEHLDAYVTGRVLRRLNEPGFVSAVHADADHPGAGAEITALERRKTEAVAKLEELADHPDIDPALLARSLSSFDRKIKQLRNQMAATSRQRLLARMAGITKEQWDAEPIDVRAETVRALFRVVVLPATWRGPGFDPASVRLERRVGDGDPVGG